MHQEGVEGKREGEGNAASHHGVSEKSLRNRWCNISSPRSISIAIKRAYGMALVAFVTTMASTSATTQYLASSVYDSDRWESHTSMSTVDGSCFRLRK